MRNLEPCSVFYGKIAKNPRYVKTLTLVVIRIVNDGLDNSKPCKHCCEFIKSVGIKKIIYSVKGGLVKQNVRDLSNEHLSLGSRRGVKYPLLKVRC